MFTVWMLEKSEKMPVPGALVVYKLRQLNELDLGYNIQEIWGTNNLFWRFEYLTTVL